MDPASPGCPRDPIATSQVLQPYMLTLLELSSSHTCLHGKRLGTEPSPVSSVIKEYFPPFKDTEVALCSRLADLYRGFYLPRDSEAGHRPAVLLGEAKYMEALSA